MALGVQVGAAGPPDILGQTRGPRGAGASRGPRTCKLYQQNVPGLHAAGVPATPLAPLPGSARPLLAGRPARSAGWGRGMPADSRAAMTEIHSELQLVVLSFSGAPAN